MKINMKMNKYLIKNIYYSYRMEKVEIRKDSLTAHIKNVLNFLFNFSFYIFRFLLV